jgi:hypothetical protein
MTFPDDNRDEPGKGPPDEQTEPELPFDEDAAWRVIVAHYGDRPELGMTAADESRPGSPADPAASPERSPANPFDRSYLDAVDGATQAPSSRSDEEHFVPPEPPPVPHTTPARRLAWIGLFGAPLMMLVAVVGHLTYPTWVSMGLVAAFVGGFVFLVATMERPGGDGWGNDDGAVV